MRSALPTPKELLQLGGLLLLALVGLLAWSSDSSESVWDLIAGPGIVLLITGILAVGFWKWRSVKRFVTASSAMLLVRIAVAVNGLMIVVLMICLLALDPDEAEDAVDLIGGSLASFAGLCVLYVMFRYEPRAAFVYLQITVGLSLMVLFVWGTVQAGAGIGVFGEIISILLNGWAIYAFLRYRQSRQDELAHVIGAAVAGGLPLAPALRSCLADRPQPNRLREALVAPIYLILPLYLYVRMCVAWRRYDRLVEELADRLERGESLSSAMRSVPGVADRETRLAVALGERTGTLATCLRDVQRERWTAAWLEVAPRFLYPPAVLLFVAGITTFLTLAILPKFEKIFKDFDEKLPAVTLAIVDVFAWLDTYAILTSIAKVLLVAGISLAIANPTARWHMPILGRLYRSGIQATVLRTLGRLLAAGQTVSQSLEFLGESEDLPLVVKRRLRDAHTIVERGETLDAALERVGLLPRSMSPLVRAAERVRTLPWALGELGDHLAGRAFRMVRRLSLIVSPLMLLAVGFMVAFVVIGIFMPLIQLISRLDE